MTAGVEAYHRIKAAQAEGRIGPEFTIDDVRRIWPECKDWALRDHYRGRRLRAPSDHPGRRELFIQLKRGLYSLDPDAQL